MRKSHFILFVVFLFIASGLKSSMAGILDLEKLCKSVYDIYASEEVAAKKEVLVYKKLNEMMGQTYTVKIIATDSVGYDRKQDVSSLKSEEVYTSDAKTGYFGVFIRAVQNGDALLMTSTPGKEMTFTGRITDIIVTQYMKNNVNQKSYTSLKEFDDKGTIITQIILVLEI